MGQTVAIFDTVARQLYKMTKFSGDDEVIEEVKAHHRKVSKSGGIQTSASNNIGDTIIATSISTSIPSIKVDQFIKVIEKNGFDLYLNGISVLIPSSYRNNQKDMEEIIQDVKNSFMSILDMTDNKTHYYSQMGLIDVRHVETPIRVPMYDVIMITTALCFSYVVIKSLLPMVPECTIMERVLAKSNLSEATKEHLRNILEKCQSPKAVKAIIKDGTIYKELF